MPEEKPADRGKGSGAFARILRSEVLLHTRQEGVTESVESQLTGWGFDVRVQRSLASMSVSIVSGVGHDASQKLVLLDQPSAATIEDLCLAISEARVEIPVTWILVNPDREVLPLLDRFGNSARVVEGLESNLFDAMVWAAARIEGEGVQVSSPTVEVAEPASTPSNSAADPNPGSGRVLLVEDNEINRMVVEEILDETEIELEFAENGREAVEAVAEQSFDLVLMDCQMPVLDGFEATRQIRELEAKGIRCHPSGHIPIVALTANAIRGDQARCLAAGMDDYLTKPFEDALLLEVIGRYLSADDTAAAESPVAKHGSEAVPTGSAPFQPGECLGRCAGNLDLAKRLIGMLLEQGDREIPQMAEQVANEDWEQLKLTAHGLRGAAGNLGAVGLHDELSKLETAAAESTDRGNLIPILDRTKEELARFRESDPLFALDQHATTEGPTGSRSRA